MCTRPCCHMNKNVCTHCQTTLDDGEAKLPNQRKIAPHSHSCQCERSESREEKNTPWAENASVCWQLLHAIVWFGCFSLIFLFGFVCGALVSSAACQPGIRITYCYILLTKVSAWLSRDTSFFHSAHLCFSLKEHIVTIDFHVTSNVISYHSFNFFIFSNLIHTFHHINCFPSKNHSRKISGDAFNFSANILLTCIFHITFCQLKHLVPL